MLEHTPDVLTIPEAAETLKLSVSAIQSLVDNGEIEHLENAGQTLIFKPFLVNYIEKLRKACYTEIADASKAPQGHLDNCTGQDIPPFSEGDAEMAKYKINQPVMINGEKRWITANSMQEVADKITKLLGTPQDRGKHPFEEYAWNWFETYSKPNIEAATAITYERQIRLHLIPAFSKAIEDITVDDVQRLFNSMEGTAKTTKDKARMVLNQILNSAVEDQIIEKNPLNSNRLKITGEPSKPTEPYTVEQMRYLVKHLDDIKKPRDRAFLALVAFHPVRPEEAFGLAPEDIDRENMALHIRQAVTHPGRNQPILKDTKTYSSARTIALSSVALTYLQLSETGPYFLGGERPLSCMQVRRMCERIQSDTGFSDHITPSRFRTTILTDLYDQTKDIKLAQATAGHTTSAMTLKYYVKGRETPADAVTAVEKLYAG